MRVSTAFPKDQLSAESNDKRLLCARGGFVAAIDAF